MTCPDCGGSGEFEILNSGMGSAVCLVCGGTGDSGGVNMEQLLVREYHDHNCGMIGCAVVSERPATPAEVLAYAATLDGAERMGTFEWMNGRGQPDGHYIEVTRPGRYLVIPLPDKETTDE